MSAGTTQERVYCPVCQAKFRLNEKWKAGDIVVCPICGQKLKLEKTPEGWAGSRPNKGDEKEIRDRVDEYARIKGYVFNDMKEELIQGLLGKARRFGDFYCPCRMEHVPEFMCPCKPTRGGDVDKLGKCYCGLNWKKT